MLTPEIAADVVAQCQVAAGEIGQAFARAFGSPIEVTIGEPTSLRLLDVSDGLESPGVVVTLHFGLAAMAILVPQAGGLLPRGYDSNDAKAQSTLVTLAQELAMLVLPEALLAEDTEAFCVKHLATALGEGGAADSATLVPLALNAAGKQGEAFVIWPLSNARDIKKAIDSGVAKASVAHGADPSATADEVAPVAAGEASTTALREPDATNLRDLASDDGSGRPATIGSSDIQPAGALRTAARSDSRKKEPERGPTLRDLPPYSRSLLKIRVPLSVTLAEKRQPLGQILEIGPGSILQFEKSCEEMLDLNVSNLAIARGEAVKVGDKFGLRVTSLILPSERFKPVRPALPGSMPATV